MSGSRPRSGRSARFDRAILDAAVTVADLEGWSGMTFQRLATRAGVSRNAVLGRHADRPALAAAVWRERLAQPLIESLKGVLAACPAPKGAASEQELTQTLTAFSYPTEALRAAAELLLVARYEPVLQDAIDESLGAFLDTWLTPRRGRLPRSQAAQRAFVVSLALGLLIQARRQSNAQIDLTGALTRLAHALSNPAAASWLPADSGGYMDGPASFDIEDVTWAAVLQATLDEVGAHGYDAATVDDIARSSGYTQGAIFSRYATKLELFRDATERMLTNNGRLSAQWQADIAARTSVGIADATMVREMMVPERKALRTITFEAIRLSWHEPDMLHGVQAALEDLVASVAAADPTMSLQQARALIQIEFARGLGVGVLADLHADAWKLPYDVVIVPFLQS